MLLLDLLLNSNGGSPSSSCEIIRREGVRSDLNLREFEFCLQLAMFNRRAAATSRFGGTCTFRDTSIHCILYCTGIYTVTYKHSGL